MYIDSHCHLDFSEFDSDRDGLLNECHTHGISHFIVPGISLAQSFELLTFAKQYSSVRIGAGLHPYFLTEHEFEHINQLYDFAKLHHQQLVAIGECGLDRSIEKLDKQIQLFELHIELANQLALPLIVHHRQSHDLIAHAFKRVKPQYGGVIHAFSGSQQQADYYIKQGFKLGVGGVITYQRAKKTRTVIANTPIEHLLLETDAPSMPLAGFQGQRNSPLQLIKVFEQLAELKNAKGDCKVQLQQQLYDSSSTLFCI